MITLRLVYFSLITLFSRQIGFFQIVKEQRESKHLEVKKQKPYYTHAKEIQI
jgi:hypothetical protein